MTLTEVDVTNASSGQLTVYGSRCLDAAGSGNGSAVPIYSRNGPAHQRFPLS